LFTWIIPAVIIEPCFLPYAILGLSLPGVRFGYMLHGPYYCSCHQLNRVLTVQNNVSEKWYPTLSAGSTERLPFQVYSVTYDADAELVAVCGAVGMSDDVNLAVFRVMDIPPSARRGASGSGTAAAGSGREVVSGFDSQQTGAAAREQARAAPGEGEEGEGAAEPEPEPSVMFIPVAEKGVGVMNARHGREMLNCVRFGGGCTS
jgi:hypothetical protein